MVPVLAGISLVLFTILALAPGDPFEELAANPNVPREVAQALRHQYGLDDPVAVRYVRWFSAMLKGDWGFSFVSRVNVDRSEEHTSELQSLAYLVCRLLLEKKKKIERQQDSNVGSNMYI